MALVLHSKRRVGDRRAASQPVGDKTPHSDRRIESAQRYFQTGQIAVCKQWDVDTDVVAAVGKGHGGDMESVWGQKLLIPI